MEEIGTIRFNRVIVLMDAKTLDNETIGTGGASKQIICAAIYAGVKKRVGTFFQNDKKGGGGGGGV